MKFLCCLVACLFITAQAMDVGNDPVNPLPTSIIKNGEWFEVLNICYTPDGAKLAQLGLIRRDTQQCIVRLFDTASGYESYTDLINTGYSSGGLAITADNRELAADFQASKTEYNIKIWDLETAKQKLILKGATDAINCLDYQKNNAALLVSGSRDGLARIWDTRTGKCVKALVCSTTNTVNRVSWRPDGQQIATCQWDNFAKLWDPKTGKYIQTQALTAPLGNAAYSPSGTNLSCAQPGQLVVCDTTTGQVKSTVAYWPNASLTAFANALQYLPHHEQTVLAGMSTLNGDMGLCDLASAQNSIRFSGGDGVYYLTCPDNGQTVAVCVGSANKVVKTFDIAALSQTLITKKKIEIDLKERAMVHGSVFEDPGIESYLCGLCNLN